MTTRLRISILHGGSFVSDDDRYRAEDAALEIIKQAGCTVEAAAAAYRHQWLSLDDERGMTGLALVWIAARSAADIALTEGWADCDGASCDIEA